MDTGNFKPAALEDLQFAPKYIANVYKYTDNFSQNAWFTYKLRKNKTVGIHYNL